jgi:hypothetical protein
MTGPEHYRKAEQLLAEISGYGGVPVNDLDMGRAAVAQVHATLALVELMAASELRGEAQS